MELEKFKSKLSKKELESLAVNTLNRYMETTDALEILLFSKKLKVFTETLVRVSEVEAKLVWESQKERHPEMNYVNGGHILDYEKDEVYLNIKNQLAERKELLDLAFKQKDKIFDGDGAEVMKVPIKSYRKDSISVKL